MKEFPSLRLCADLLLLSLDSVVLLTRFAFVRRYILYCTKQTDWVKKKLSVESRSMCTVVCQVIYLIHRWKRSSGIGTSAAAMSLITMITDIILSEYRER